MTRNTVYAGIASIMPGIWASEAPANIIIKISNGCAFTLFEKISGWRMTLSMICTPAKTDPTFTTNQNTSVLLTTSIEVDNPTIIPNNAPRIGPRYGIKLATAANRAMVMA